MHIEQVISKLESGGYQEEILSHLTEVEQNLVAQLEVLKLECRELRKNIGRNKALRELANLGARWSVPDTQEDAEWERTIAAKCDVIRIIGEQLEQVQEVRKLYDKEPSGELW